MSRSYLSQLEKGFYASLNVVGRPAKAPKVEAAESLKLSARRGRRHEGERQ